MKNAAAFVATYSDWRLIKGRKVVQVVFELPLEAANEAYAALGGMPNPAAESWFAICRLVQTTGKEKAAPTIEAHQPEQPASVLTPSPVRVPTAYSRDKLPQLAGMLSQTPLFHRYLEIVHDVEVGYTEKAASFIRSKCSVESRSQIIGGTPAGEKFLKIYDDFVLWRDSDSFLEADQNETAQEGPPQSPPPS